MSYLPLIIQLVSGAVGANVVGNAVKSLNLGPVGNTIAGLVGGGIGGQLVTALGTGGATGGLDVGALLGSVGGGAAGGGALTALSAYLKLMFAKPT
jgi:uncharacterized membrane protein YeaQ/YmgE (transglycosylase-associated protein family)